MTCKKCGCATEITRDEGGRTEGRFKEVWECVNGHIGWVRGEASAPPQQWTRTGSVFEG